MKKVKWTGFFRIFPIERGVIKPGKKIWIANMDLKEKFFNGVSIDDYLTNIVVEDIQGKITKVGENKNYVFVEAEFHPKIKTRTNRKMLLKLILNNIDFHKENMEKVLSKMLYYNFNSEDLEKMSKSKIFFERPKIFENSWYGEKIYIRTNRTKNKYYEI